MRFARLYGTAALLSVSPALQAAVQPPAPMPTQLTMNAGPVYTSSVDSAHSSYPQFPTLQIQVELPAGTSPDLETPAAFRLAIDGRHSVTASRVQTLASTGYGLSASLSLDVSGSMNGAPLNAVRAGLTKFVNDAGPHDKVAIQTIADDSRWDVDWNDSRARVHTALDQLATRGRLTRLWDGLTIAIQHLPASPLARRLIVISDGHDEGSHHSEDQVIAAARAAGIPIDAIGITRSDPAYLQALQQLATATGGQFRAAKDTNELEQLVGSGITRLKATPVVSFEVARSLGDGKAHHFDITWTHDGSPSMAEAAAVLPVTSFFSREYWLWISGCGLLGIAGGFVLAFAFRKPRQPAPAPQLAAPQVSASSAPRPVEPQPLAAAPPSRQPTPSFLPSESEDAPSPRRLTPPVTSSDAAAARAKTIIGARYQQPLQDRPAAWLLCESGFAIGERFAVDQAEYWIGSLEGNHLRILDDPTVSRNHACLVFDHDALGIYDHHSTNGTRVNGEFLKNERRLLQPGDRIQIGQSLFVVQVK